MLTWMLTLMWNLIRMLLGPEATTADTTVLHVSLSAREDGTGTFDRPFAGLVQARDAIRRLRIRGELDGPVEVRLRGGTYRINETFVLTPQDSGTDSAPVTYRSYPGETAVISGGEVLQPSWQRVDGGIYMAHIGPALFNSLFVDGVRATRARTPNEDYDFPYFLLQSADSAGPHPTDFIFQPGQIDPAWSRLDQVEIVSFRRWEQSRSRIETITGDRVTVTGDVRHGFGYAHGGKDRYYVENVLEALDSPGEWYLDKTAGELYYWPLPGTDIHESEFIYPRLTQLIKAGDFEGTHLLGLVVDGEDLGFGTRDFSLSAWYRFPVTGNPKYSIGKGEAWLSAGYAVAHWQDADGKPVTPQLILHDDAGMRIACNSDPVNRDEWVHLSWTVDRGEGLCRAYVNGEVSRETDISALGDIGNDASLLVGFYSSANVFSGVMDEFHLWKRALTGAEISAVYQQPEDHGMTKGLVLYLPFDGGSVADESGCGRDVARPMIPLSFVDGIADGAMSMSGGAQPPADWLRGNPDVVENVHFRNLVFMHTDWTLPTTGYPGRHAGVAIESDPAVRMVARNASLKGCVWALTGADGFQGFGENISVIGNAFRDIGARGVVFGGLGDSSPSQILLLARLARNNVISDNVFEDNGMVYRDGVPIVVFQGKNNRITHNEIVNANYSGMVVGFFLLAPEGQEEEMSRWVGGNIIEANHVHHAMRELDDGGGIYVFGFQPGTVIRRNKVHDIVRTPRHFGNDVHWRRWGIYVDGTSRGITVRDNLIVRTTSGGIMLQSSQSGTRDNLAMNNILVGGVEFDVSPFWSYWNRFTGNIIVNTRRECGLFIIRSADAIMESDYNLFHSTAWADAGEFKQEQDWDQWMSYGFDLHSVFADPLFRDPGSDDYTLQPASPARLPRQAGGIGFEDIDLGDVGPR